MRQRRTRAVRGSKPAVAPRVSFFYRRTEQRRPPVSKRNETKVRIVWGSFLIAAAALKTPTRNGYNAQGTNLTFCPEFSGCIGFFVLALWALYFFVVFVADTSTLCASSE